MPRQKAQKREMKSCRLYLENNLSEAKVERLCQFMNRPNIRCKNVGEKKINDILVKRMAKASLFLFVTIYGQ